MQNKNIIDIIKGTLNNLLEETKESEKADRPSVTQTGTEVWKHKGRKRLFRQPRQRKKSPQKAALTAG